MNVRRSEAAASSLTADAPEAEYRSDAERERPGRERDWAHAWTVPGACVLAEIVEPGAARVYQCDERDECSESRRCTGDAQRQIHYGRSPRNAKETRGANNAAAAL
jgi:hypothetical protein